MLYWDTLNKVPGSMRRLGQDEHWYESSTMEMIYEYHDSESPLALQGLLPLRLSSTWQHINITLQKKSMTVNF